MLPESRASLFNALALAPTPCSLLPGPVAQLDELQRRLRDIQSTKESTHEQLERMKDELERERLERQRATQSLQGVQVRPVPAQHGAGVCEAPACVLSCGHTDRAHSLARLLPTARSQGKLSEVERTTQEEVRRREEEKVKALQMVGTLPPASLGPRSAT